MRTTGNGANTGRVKVCDNNDIVCLWCESHDQVTERDRQRKTIDTD